MGKRAWLIAAIVLLAVVPVTGPAAPEAYAQQGLTLATPFLGVVARPGETVSFPLRIVNRGSTDQSVTLELTSVPKGWEALLTGDGRPVYRVFAQADSEQTVQLQVKVPDAAKPAEYHLNVSAKSPGLQRTLQLGIRVSTADTGSDRLATQYPALTGPSDATFKFRVDLTNSSSHERSYSLAARAPEGWQVTFSPAYEDKQIASLSLGAGETRGLDVNIKPPPAVPAGPYRVTVQATSASSQPTTDLEVNIIGSFNLNVTTPSGRLNTTARAGRESALQLVLQNAGSAEIPQVSLSSSTPTGWTARYEPDRIDSLAPGEKREVTAFIRPDARAIAGDYQLTVTASAPGAWDSADIRVTVETPTAMGIMGTFIVLMVVAGVGWVFHRYGRR